MKTLLLIVVLFPLVLHAQTPERLFCGACGKENQIQYAYCYFCGTCLEKTSLVERLHAKLAQAESSGVALTLSAAELRVLLDTEVTRLPAAGESRRELPQLARPKSDAEKTLEIVAPFVMALTTMFLLRQAYAR